MNIPSRLSSLSSLSSSVLRVARRWSQPAWFGTLHRTTPLSQRWGYDRGLPIDRHYIQQFLSQHASDIRGATLEVGDDRYTRALGAANVRDVLDVVKTPRATVIADLCDASSVPRDRFDAFVCVQTLQYVEDVRRALVNARRMLHTGGVLLATVPGIAMVDRGAKTTDRWRFTPMQLRAWAEDAFGKNAQISVETLGNPLSACGALMGLASQDLKARELDATDPDYPVILTLRAVR